MTVISMLLLSGCVNVKLNNSARLIERHPRGFEDAVAASPEATEFVRDALKTINELEYQIEKNSL